MSSVVRLAAIWLGLTAGGPPTAAAGPGPSFTPDALPATARVVAASLDMLARPEESGSFLGRLARGDVVQVVDVDAASGWATIAPPPGSFAWVEQRALQIDGPGRGRVGRGGARMRAGVDGARLPGPLLATLAPGSAVAPLDRPTLITGTGARSIVWQAVEAPASAVRYIRMEGLEPIARPSTKVNDPGDAAIQRAAYSEVGAGSLAGVPPEVADEVARIEAEHRAILDVPIERWRFDAVKARYEALTARLNDPAGKAALQERLDLVARHEAIARSARTIQTILDRSRRRDALVEATRRDLAAIDEPKRRPFVARGLIQPSSRQVDGRRVYALIGPEGRAVAYLDVPPGLDARSVLARQVGVRGNVSYNESLGTRLIAVRDLEPLE